MTERAVLCTDGCYYWIEWEPIADEPPEPVASDDEIDAWVRDERGGWWDSLPEQEDEPDFEFNWEGDDD